MTELKTDAHLLQTAVSGSIFVNADCFDVFPNIEDNSIDAIICDLPYGTTQCKWDSVLPFDKLWEQYVRIIKPNGAIILFGSQPFTSALIMSKISWFKYELIWHKSHPTGFASSKKRTMKYHENILVFYNKQPTYNPQMTKGKPNHWTVNKAGTVSNSQPKLGEIENKNGDNKFPNSVMYFNCPNRNGILHPTQKPLELLEYLVKTYTNEGDMVLDNCMGSGTTGLACKKTYRNFLGIEKDKNYFDIAVRRVSEYCH